MRGKEGKIGNYIRHLIKQCKTFASISVIFLMFLNAERMSSSKEGIASQIKIHFNINNNSNNNIKSNFILQIEIEHSW